MSTTMPRGTATNVAEDWPNHAAHPRRIHVDAAGRDYIHIAIRLVSLTVARLFTWFAIYGSCAT